MATISELNVRLGLLYKDFDASLKKVERDLERSGRKFSQLGSDLTLAVSAPLAALGAAAIKQAGEIESLKLAMTSTFESAGRSAAEAAKEVEALREAAKAPGLDFEQAVRGSIRLQGVGLAAEEARRILGEMANAIASTGGTAEDLDGVTRQFSQMIAKGRVLQEDVSILAERMPVISRLMQQAFGTASVEAIRSSGVTAKQFVDRITEAAATLPRVEGGIKNALVNAGAEARNSLAKLGEAIVKALDVPKLLEDFAKGLAGIAEWFDGLSKSTKTAIVQVGLFVVALGPMVKIIGVIQSTRAAVVGFFASMVGVLKNVASAAISAATAFNALNLASRAFILAGIAFAIASAVSALVEMNRELTTAQKVQQSLNQITKEASGDISKERVAVNELVAVIKDENQTREEQQKALKTLQSLAPEQFRNLTIETAKTAELDGAVNAYIDSLLRAAKAKRAFARLEEIDALRESLIETADPSIWQSLGNAVLSAGNSLSLTGLQANTQAANFVKLRDALNSEEEALRGVIAENGGLQNAMSGSATATNNFTNAVGDNTDKAKKQSDTYKDVLKSIDDVNKKQAELGADFIGEKTKEIEGGVEKLIEAGFAPGSAPVQKLKGYLQQIRAEIAKGFAFSNEAQVSVGVTGTPDAPQQLATLPTPTNIQSTQKPGSTEAIAKALMLATEQAIIFDTALVGAQVHWAEWIAQIQASQEYLTTFWDATGAAMQAVGQSIVVLGNTIEKSLADSSSSFKQFAKEAITAVADVIAALIKQAVAAAIAGAFKSAGNPILGAALAAIGGALAAGLFKKLVGAATYKAFAKGGVITEPTMALMGEYPGARTNPEIITPERLMRSVFRDEAAGMGGRVEVYGVIRGSDIHLSNEKATRDRGRIR